MKLSLSIKIVSALLTTSVSAVLLVALATPPLLENRFLEETRQNHMGNFERLIGRYLSRGNAENWGGRDSALNFNRTVIQADQRRQAERPQLSGHDPFASDRLRYVIADHQGYIIHPFFDYVAGQQFTDAERSEATKLFVDGQHVGLALARGENRLSPRDEAYFDLLQRMLLVSGAFAVLLALLLGWVITRPISHRLSRLTHAVRTLQPETATALPDDPHKDEIATLTQAFKRMSQALSDQYTELKNSHATITRQARSLEKLSYTDPLTGLYNRRHFDEQLNECWTSAIADDGDLSLILLDIDHFKQVNDTYSHQVGDEVLEVVARELQQVVRGQDILARYGGEELVLLMPETHRDQAKEIGVRMRQKIEQFDWGKLAIGLAVTASVGVASKTSDTTALSLLKRADQQLYKAKDAGRNRVCVA